MSDLKFELAGAELDWPIIAGAGMSNHPAIEATAARIENQVDNGITVAMAGSWTLGDVRGGNGYEWTGSGWDYVGGDEYVDLSTGKGYNAKSLPNVGTDLGMESIGDLVDLANSRGSELALSFSPISGNPQEELRELTEQARKALARGVLYVEMNLSCPNIKGKPAFYLDPEGVNEYLMYLASIPSLENKYGHAGLYLKFGPGAGDKFNPFAYLDSAKNIGGVTTSNTVGNQEPKTKDGKPAIKFNEGKAGMSGPALKEQGRIELDKTVLATQNIERSLEVISVMGVDSGQEVLERLSRRAAAVQLASVIYWPALVNCEDAGEVVEKIKGEIVDNAA